MDTKNPELGNSAEEVLRRARAAKEELSGLATAVAGIAGGVKQGLDIDRRLREEPVKTLLIAAGIGYIAGGGFFTPTTSRMLRLGARLWLLPTIRRSLINQQEYH